MAAVFRTPLGAALLAVEVLHRDDFESDALVPSVLASVVAYSVFISFFGEATLFAHAARYPFVPAHLPLYALLAILVSVVASGFLGVAPRVAALHRSARQLPDWVKPGVGGLALGHLRDADRDARRPARRAAGARARDPRRRLRRGAGGDHRSASWFPGGWSGVELLLLLGVVKIVATSLTVGSGGSAGDFGPSLVMGGHLRRRVRPGGAAAAARPDGSIPGAFALVGMGVFYGGLAHVPIASLVMTCELAGSYDLLVPLMLAEGIAFVMLRNRSLYHAQVPTRRESPAHREDLIFDVLKGVRVGDVVVRDRPYIDVLSGARRRARSSTKVAESEWQDAFPVLGDDGKLAGVISSDVLRTMATNPDLGMFALADDMMVAAGLGAARTTTFTRRSRRC